MNRVFWYHGRTSKPNTTVSCGERGEIVADEPRLRGPGMNIPVRCRKVDLRVLARQDTHYGSARVCTPSMLMHCITNDTSYLHVYQTDQHGRPQVHTIRGRERSNVAVRIRNFY